MKAVVWVCANCGYQLEREGFTEICPDCGQVSMEKEDVNERRQTPTDQDGD